MQIKLNTCQRMRVFFKEEPKRPIYAAVTAVALAALATFVALSATAFIGTIIGISAVIVSAAVLGVGIALLLKNNSQPPEMAIGLNSPKSAPSLNPPPRPPVNEEKVNEIKPIAPEINSKQIKTGASSDVNSEANPSKQSDPVPAESDVIKRTAEAAHKEKVEAFLNCVKQLNSDRYNQDEAKKGDQFFTALSRCYGRSAWIEGHPFYLSFIVAKEAFCSHDLQFCKNPADKNTAKEALGALIDLGVDMTAGDNSSALWVLFETGIEQETEVLPYLQRIAQTISQARQKELQSLNIFNFLTANLSAEGVKWLVDDTFLVSDKQYKEAIAKKNASGQSIENLLCCQRSTILGNYPDSDIT
jgi:hypothetical protein